MSVQMIGQPKGRSLLAMYYKESVEKTFNVFGKTSKTEGLYRCGLAAKGQHRAFREQYVDALINVKHWQMLDKGYSRTYSSPSYFPPFSVLIKCFYAGTLPMSLP